MLLWHIVRHSLGHGWASRGVRRSPEVGSRSWGRVGLIYSGCAGPAVCTACAEAWRRNVEGVLRFEARRAPPFPASSAGRFAPVRAGPLVQGAGGGAGATSSAVRS